MASYPIFCCCCECKVNKLNPKIIFYLTIKSVLQERNKKKSNENKTHSHAIFTQKSFGSFSIFSIRLILGIIKEMFSNPIFF